MSLDDRLSLTLSEIVHIRTVLTKAELEALPVEGHVRSDVENRKVGVCVFALCFLSLNYLFLGLFFMLKNSFRSFGAVGSTMLNLQAHCLFKMLF